MKQTKESIRKEAERIWKRHESEKDVVKRRMLYLTYHVLIWTIENTDWQKPLEEVIDNADILKKELNNFE